jgi:UDPglucose--hexose-1-phosphate uridylyltransferase
VREAAIAKNVSWTTPTTWGDLEITINLSKPEKDPEAIAAAGKALVGAQYSACQLCIENEGYYGRGAGAAFGAHPARQNLRVVPIELGQELGLPIQPLCLLRGALHRHER